MSIDMQPQTALAIRAELAAIGTRASGLQRRQRRARVTAALVGVAAVGLTTSAAALVASGVPGSTTTAAIGAATTATHTGPALVDIGKAPDRAGAVIVDITCLNHVGMVKVSTVDGGGAGYSCRDGGSMHVTDGRTPAEGRSRFSIEASPGTRWRAVLRYASSVTSVWGLNAEGQTYGVENKHGHPDLVPATADNGREGWVFWNDVDLAEETATVDVYESDGETVIGHTTVIVGLPGVPLDQRYIDDLDPVRTASPSPHGTR
ncbi:hypothetical protein DEI81_14445 [Curtobacterium sp. MCBD17_013]|uniref:hypothetical protein n=1 Tax=Curtobacterium sp. MCBD17_013 TaxID=2175668 RepID=UPI000DA6FCCD|nr:hypothetical protein [Curtobacterium sp. MCBD17_013]PZF58724.1 hypothetical protein DEI81_14445 [Curtobacterium sp. MCBD17_013]